MNRKNQKAIAFKLLSFPNRSETFIVNQLILANLLEYEILIFVNKKFPIENSAQHELIKKHEIDKKIIEKKNLKTLPFYLKHLRILKLIITKRASVKWLKTFNFFRYGMVGFKGRLFEILYENKEILGADIVHVQFGRAKGDIDLLRSHNLIKSKIVTSYHGYDAHFNTGNFESLKDYYKLLFQVGNVFTVNSKYLLDKLLVLGCPKSKIKIIPMTVDTDYFKPIGVSKSKDFKMISVGRLIKLKGHMYGLHAVKLLIDEGYNVEYTIVGDGHEYKALKDFILLNNLNDHVTLFGAANHSDLLPLLQKSDLFLMTSITDDDGRGEAQGVVTAEAQSCGLPIIAFDSGGVSETLIDDKTGFLIPESKKELLAEKVKHLINNPDERLKMGLNARNFIVNRFSNEVIMPVWKEVYV